MSSCAILEKDNWQNSFGYGSFASHISKIKSRVIEECIEAEMITTSNLPILAALKSLETIFEECSVATWDGYHALPISAQAVEEARSFLNLLSEQSYELSMPTITPEPDGGIELEWYVSGGPEYSLSFNGSNVLTYSGIFGDNTETFGTEAITAEISPTILANIQRIYR